MANFVYGYGTSGITALKFNAPLNEQIVDPTTIEGFKMSFSGTVVYDKPKNFKNTFVNYDIASVDTYEDYKNAFYVNSGSTDTNLTSANDYYICDGGDWGEIYAVSGKTVRFPYPTDLEQKIEDGFPVKFHFTQYDKDENGFWNSLYNTMDNVEIKDTYWASDLFNGSNVPKMNLTFNPQVKTENGSTVIASTNAVLDSCFENCTKLQSVKLTRKGDTNTFNTLKKVFKNCSSLSALTFDAVDNNGDASNTKWNVGQLSNTFNGCEKLTSWPSNIVISGTEFDSTYANDNVVVMDYTFEGAGFQAIGSAEEFKVGKAQHAFNTSSAVTINSVMDMRYIHPEVQSHVDTMFGNHKIETISLKNINHNAWNFDGVSNNRTSQYIGNCSLFNQASVEYLYNNLYDLTSNNLEENIFQRKPTIPLFSEWTTGGTGVVVNGNQVTFNDANGTLSVSNANDTFFKFSVSNMSSGDKLTIDGGLNSLEITENGNYYVNVTASTCMITANNVSSNIVIDYITTWNGAVSNVTASTLYCPSEWDNSNNNRIINDEMLTIATNRGWMVYVGNELHTVRIEVVLADNVLTVGNTTTASVYFVRTRGQQETRTDITNNTGITYYSTDSNVASVDNNGTVTANGNGTANITASYFQPGYGGGTFTATTSITVNDVITYDVDVIAPSIEVEQTGQCSAEYVTYTNGVETSRVSITPTDATWSVINSNIISIDSNGRITGNTVGSTEIHCVYQGITGHTTGYVTSASLSYITVTITDAPEIPAKGGTVNCSTNGVKYEVVAHYSDNTTGIVTTYSIVDCSGVTASDRGTTTGNTIADVGTLMVKVEYEGLQATSGRTISQEANVVESTVIYSSWTHNGNIETGNTDYYISGTNLSISNLSADGGTNVSNPVSGYSVTHYTMPRSAMTEYELTYTSEHTNYVTSAETMAASAWTTTNNNESVSIRSNPNWVSNITTGTTGKFNYSSNPDTSTRSGNIVYQLTNHTASTWTTSIQQNAAMSYYVNFKFNNNKTTISASTANQQVFQGTVTATNQGWRFIGDLSEVTMSPSTGNAGTTNVTITAKTNTSFDSRVIDFSITGTVEDTVDGFIYQPGKEVTLTSITVNVSSAPDIPASGGSVTYNTNGVNYTVTGNYNDGTTSNLKTSANISSNTVSANSKGTNVSSRNNVGTLTITATKDGVTGSSNITIYQEANAVTSNWTESGKTNEGTSAWTENGDTTYYIEVDPLTKTVSSGSGSFNISVSASANTRYTGYTCETWYVTETPYSGYTSTAIRTGTTTTGTTIQKGTRTITGIGINTTQTPVGISSSSNWVTATTTTISYAANTGSLRSTTVTYYVVADSDVSATCRITQNEQSITLTGLTVTINSVPDIPASGGSVTYSTNGVSYTVLANYSDGTSSNITSSANISSNTVSANSKGTNVSSRNNVGTLTITATKDGVTGSSNITIYQEANAVTSAWTVTAITNEGTSAWTQNGTTYYNIDVNPSQASVNDSNGTLNVSVSSSAITPVSAFTCDTWKVASTPYSAYTSTAIRTGTTTTGEAQKSGTTYTQGTLSFTSTPSKVFANGPEWVTASTSNIKYAAFTEGSTSARTSTTVYSVTAAPSVKESCEITQTRTTRNVTVNFTDDWYISTTLTGTPNVAVSMVGDTGAGAGDSSGEMNINTTYPFSLAGQSLIKIIDNTATTVEVLIQFALDYTLPGNNYINATSGGSTYGISGNHLFDGGNANINMYIPISKGQYDTSVNVGSISWSVHS